MSMSNLNTVQSSEHKPVWSSEYKHEIQSFWSWRYSIYGGTQINLHLPLTGPGELQKVQKQGFTVDKLHLPTGFWLKGQQMKNWCQARLQEISKQCCKQFIPCLPRNWLSDINSILETSSTDKKFVNEQIGKHSELLSNSSLTELSLTQGTEKKTWCQHEIGNNMQVQTWHHTQDITRRFRFKLKPELTSSWVFFFEESHPPEIQLMSNWWGKHKEKLLPSIRRCIQQKSWRIQGYAV